MSGRMARIERAMGLPEQPPSGFAGRRETQSALKTAPSLVTVFQEDSLVCRGSTPAGPPPGTALRESVRASWGQVCFRLRCA